MNNFSLQDIKNLIEKAVLEESTLPFLDSKYNEVKNIVGHSNVYYKLFYLIAKELNPDIVVELGGWRGYGAAHFAGGNPDALVITIDHHSDPGDDVNQQKMLECCQQFNNMNYVQGWTTPGYVEEWHKGVNGYDKVLKILDGRKIDVLFIDSWHEGRYFLRDWNYYKPLLNSPSLVIADDLFDSDLFVKMLAAWDSLDYEKFTDCRLHLGIPMGVLKYG